MAKILFTALLLMVLSRAYAGNENGGTDGGDKVNNGGGLTEQYVLNASLHFYSGLRMCESQFTCQSGWERDLLALLSCELPKPETLVFATKENAKGLDDGTSAGLAYFSESKNRFIINRSYLYKNDLPLSLGSTFALVTRVYLDYCSISRFSNTEFLSSKLQPLLDSVGERITIGKDQINLPRSKWIRAQSFFNELMIDSGNKVTRLVCDDEKNCQVSSLALGQAKFRDLSLLRQSIDGETISFTILARLVVDKRLQSFVGQFDVKDGQVVKANINGKELLLPTGK